MITREQFYEILVGSLGWYEFIHIFGVEPVDIWDLDYNFKRDVHWNYNLEYAYNEFISDENEEID